MQESTWKFPGRLAIGLLFCLAVSPLMADDSTPTPPVNDPPDPPGTTVYMAQLRMLWSVWDVNKDGYLDKQELATAFRGAGAKPYDYDPKADKAKATPTTTDKPADAPADKPADKPDDSTGLTKQGASSSSSSSTTPKADYSQYPDYVFLTQLDTDGDSQISRSEFMTWARGYATQLKAQADTLQKIAQLQAQLANPKLTAAEIKKLQAELQKAQAASNKHGSQVKSFESSLTQAMNKKKS
jgi:Ca2+-binding EF-hand superfamily protein